MRIDRAIRITRQRFKKSGYRIRFYRLLRDYVVDGRMAFAEVFRRLAARKTQNRERDAIVFETLAILVDVENQDVMTALKEVLPQEEVLLLEATPKEDMSTGFDQIIRLAEGKAAIQQGVLTAIALGSLSILAGIPVFLTQLYIVVPAYLDVLPVDAWPPGTEFVLTLHELFIVNYWIVPSVLLGLIVFVVITLNQKSRWLRRILDVCPPWSIQRSIQSSSFVISLGSLLSKRISFPLALEKIQGVAPSYLQGHVDHMLDRVDDNQEPEEVIDTGLLPKERMDYIRDFVGQSSFSKVLTQQGYAAISQLPGRVKAMMLTFMAVLIISVFAANIYIGFSGQRISAATKDYYERNI